MVVFLQTGESSKKQILGVVTSVLEQCAIAEAQSALQQVFAHFDLTRYRLTCQSLNHYTPFQFRVCCNGVLI